MTIEGMFIGEAVNASEDLFVSAIDSSGSLLGGVIEEVGLLGKWIEALGLAVVIWLGFQIVFFIINKKKQRLLEDIQERMARIEDKVDRLSSVKHKR